MKEKLIELIRQGARGHTFMPTESIANYLINNGVIIQKWIPVTEQLPEERDSIFEKFYGTKRWTPLMFRKISNEVLAIVKYEDGTRKVKTVHTTDGEWRLINLYQAKEVTHWMPLPEPPKEVE
jgi:hypothetical protein